VPELHTHRPAVTAHGDNQPPILFVPEYASHFQAELTENHRLLARLATCFGALPLTLGIFDFLVWIPTRAHVFELGGLLIILLGLLCTFIGALLLLIQLCSIRGSGKLKLFFRTSRLALFLILVNYPVALGIIYLVAWISPMLD
jgi:hypothetical protein